MSAPMLKSLDVQNFRSIRGLIHAPLDAKVVLVHGENGAGKTSLLSAIELALTGRVIALERADPNYTVQLLQRGADVGRVTLQTTGLVDLNTFETRLTPVGITTPTMLATEPAAFFSERCYLPQVLLGQLLQIYQDSDSSPDSPLARFVTELLGLNRLDAIETGLGPVTDLRNLRKTSNLFGQIESEKQRLDRLIRDHRQTRSVAEAALTAALTDINAARKMLGFTDLVDEDNLSSIVEQVQASSEDEPIAMLIDHQRTLASIQRDVAQDLGTADTTEANLAAQQRDAAAQLQLWSSQHAASIGRLNARINVVLPNLVSSVSDLPAWFAETSGQLTEALRQAAERSSRASADASRRATVQAELDAERRNLATLVSEIGLIGENAGSLAEVLSELSAYLVSDVCPVCDRDYSDLQRGSLVDHVHAKVGTLSGAAERLLSLGRSRSLQQEQVDRLLREEAAIASRELAPQAIADLERRTTELNTVVNELARLAAPIVTQGELASAETAARSALSEHQARSLSRRSAAARLAAVAVALNQPAPDPLRLISDGIAALGKVIDKDLEVLKGKATARRRILDAVPQAKIQFGRRREADSQIENESKRERLHDAALKRAGKIRSDGQAIKSAVETVRARIIGREFNDRLNKLWRDLFIRLAPTEPFIPAFKIPTETTHQLKPKLVTLHKTGGPGGTPGAMLSAGNLNTAALTLFIALHLTVTPQLPWLILDDPVQSMDDIHIAHFAALLRTLSKEHHRQVIVAVHDRQLFEYLRLELSPAFEEDSLLTLELSRNATRNTDLLPKWYRYKQETVFRAA